MGVYTAARVNSDNQSYRVTAVELPSALHPILGSSSSRGTSYFASVVFTHAVANKWNYLQIFWVVAEYLSSGT